MHILSKMKSINKHCRKKSNVDYKYIIGYNTYIIQAPKAYERWKNRIEKNS